MSLRCSVLILLGLWLLGGEGTSAQEVVNVLSAIGDNVTQTVNSNPVTFSLTTSASVVTPLTLIKTADRAAAEPGDTIVYRLLLENQGGSLTNISLTDNLPLGLKFLPNSFQVAIGTGTVQNDLEDGVSVTTNQGTLNFNLNSLGTQQTATIVYAATVTPDAIRGDGKNTAREPRSNIASFTVRIRPGILSDCGTIIGRVFVDKNFDGEQQRGEPGVANAVVLMEDGNRITTDENGLFSLANVLAGDRVGTLDLTSIPGYTLAPNLYFIERNSVSRWVRLEPGGLGRMNFAITPDGS